MGNLNTMGNNLKTTLFKHFFDVIMFLPNKEIKEYIFREWVDYMDVNVSMESLNRNLSSKKLPNLTQEEFDYELGFIKHVIGRFLTGNTFNMENSFKLMKEKKWDKFYVFVDIHSTILYPDYGGMSKKYCPYAKEVLKKMTKDKRTALILYTCSYPNEIEEYIEFFKKDGIKFDNVNKNPEVANTRGGFFQDKPYMNMLLDDKSGFVPEYDWFVIDCAYRKYFIFD